MIKISKDGPLISISTDLACEKMFIEHFSELVADMVEDRAFDVDWRVF